MSSNEAEAVTRSVRRHLAVGMCVGLALLATAGAWAATTQLAGALVASGHFVVDSHVKKVQHPTGGVVGEILVEEGDKVEAGQVLMRLDPTQTRANLGIVTKRMDELMARLARLEAERDDRADLEFPADLTARAGEMAVASAIDSERKLFEYRRRSREGRRSQLLERIAQLEHEIAGLKAQQQAHERGLSILEGEIASLRSLHQRGIVSVQRLNELETRAATFEGLRGEKIAQQAQAAGRIAETKLQILQIDEDLKTEVGRELREVQAQLGEFTERKIAAEDQLKRIDMLAPQSGIVHQLDVHTVGGVISPADVVMSIGPDSDRLAIEARIRPQDIDQIQLGQAVVLRLSAFNQRTTPELGGSVSRIAADLTEDPRSGLSYYVVRVALSGAELSRLGSLEPLPGMPAEAFIQTGQRTALSYLVKPLSDQISRAFREE
ncbi:HlyD family type I secretion periplasmic adaptor subunit [Mesorhizobium plurifarium]|uniref:HlyD family type I secretion periplasmic adaptor subunit n=1 Tax=Sinorhizobium arboris TaxID=76745 RepID=UPI00040A00E8|nr:HlyD family type I secretion periplasmic adaptor subunit [Sinorhizobium arboris]PST22008.1 HlyD family type I secretion periplasmic adaptor subunit [Mesorhizobium plurifarium]